jgi:hypothetical protein
MADCARLRSRQTNPCRTRPMAVMARPHGKPRKRVYRYKRPGKNLASFSLHSHQPRSAQADRGFFLPAAARKRPAPGSSSGSISSGAEPVSRRPGFLGNIAQASDGDSAESGAPSVCSGDQSLSCGRLRARRRNRPAHLNLGTASPITACDLSGPKSPVERASMGRHASKRPGCHRWEKGFACSASAVWVSPRASR